MPESEVRSESQSERDMSPPQYKVCVNAGSAEKEKRLNVNIENSRDVVKGRRILNRRCHMKLGKSSKEIADYETRDTCSHLVRNASRSATTPTTFATTMRIKELILEGQFANKTYAYKLK